MRDSYKKNVSFSIRTSIFVWNKFWNKTANHKKKTRHKCNKLLHFVICYQVVLWFTCLYVILYRIIRVFFYIIFIPAQFFTFFFCLVIQNEVKYELLYIVADKLNNIWTLISAKFCFWYAETAQAIFSVREHWTVCVLY